MPCHVTSNRSPISRSTVPLLSPYGRVRASSRVVSVIRQPGDSTIATSAIGRIKVFSMLAHHQERHDLGRKCNKIVSVAVQFP